MARRLTYLYWIREPSMIDIFSEGYIGVSVVPRRRFYRHTVAQDTTVGRAIRKYGLSFSDMVFLCAGGRNLMLCMENKLRPSCNIGWNIACGGMATMSGFVLSEDAKRKISVANKGLRDTPRGSDHYRSKITESDAQEIRDLYAIGAGSQREIGDAYGVTQQSVSGIVGGKTWV